MTTSTLTREELYLLQVYRACEKNANFDQSHNSLEIGAQIRLSARQVKTTVQTLASTNFVKRADKEHIILTNHGIKLIEKILQFS